MRVATFIDTSVLLEILCVPHKSQRPQAIRDELKQRTDAGQDLLLPTAAIVETGNHIAQVANGQQRRVCAESLARVLMATTKPNPPWVLNGGHWDAALIRAICGGVRGCGALQDMAMRGIGAGDVSILAEADAYADRVAGVDVRVWTLDAGLAAYA